ncbi:hypothetical protein QJS10_CPA08g01543 [Acorus calamus]|uniref:NADP-dependent oxidoreductase domain-containing protein n=1 Tax=Acorus calamus TaxID=4465 RepID=A0AAV9EE59_ACOCL|nr:hypothetical protein QJS10_CPA08g01543 [Acorus calamus]
MAATVQRLLFSTPTFKSDGARARNARGSDPAGLRRRRTPTVRCVGTADPAATAATRKSTVRSGVGDALEICRVLNGMWQTSGGWGRIDRDAAVDAMLRYADAGLGTFDMADHWKIKTLALTNFDTERLHIIVENGIPVVSNQVQHSIVDMRPQQRMAELCQLTAYGTVMGGLLSEKFLDANISIPFAGPPLNTPSLQKYKRMVDAWGGWNLFQVLLQTLKKVATKHGVSISTVAVRYILDQPSVAGSMIGVRLGLSDHIQDTNAIFSLVLDDEDMNSIAEVSKKGKDLLKVIGDCGDEYRRA